jgi:uncharacterized protein YggE
MKSLVEIKALGLALLVIGFSGLAAAEGVARSITVIGSGEAAGPPDRATINAGVQTLAPTVTDAVRENQAVVERIVRALSSEGVENADMQTADYSIWPEQQHDARDSGEIKTVGYRVNNTVRVTVIDVEALGRILAAVTNAGANAIHGIGFDVKDTAALEARAREAAMRDARARAEALASLAGVQLGKVLTISMSPGGGYPMPMAGGRMDSVASASVPGISSGQLSIAVQVQLTYEIQ